MLKPKGGVCPKCEREVPVWGLARCPICGTEVCHKCAYLAYGRQFCSPGCSVFFFNGDGDVELEDGEETDRSEG